MPTGFTSGILDGTITSFPQFAKICTRAFGATIHMRDRDIDELYEKRVSDNYYAKEIINAERLLTNANNLSDIEIIAIEKNQIQESIDRHLKSIEKAKINYEKLIHFLEQINKWNPPTEKHFEFKKFMINQIQETINLDCNIDYYSKKLSELKKEALSLVPSVIREKMIQKAKKDYAYFTEENIKELNRCEESNQWILDLFNSLE